MKKLLLLTLCLLSIFTLKAQTITIKKIELAGEKVIVHYDLDDGNPNNEYLLNLFSSKDNFTAPLAKVKGDVGPEVKPGANKKIEWRILEEYGGYKGKIALEIRGKVYIPFLKLTNFDITKSYKRGGNYDLTFKPGNTNPIHVELYKGSQRVQGDLNHPNNGAYILSISPKVKPGNDYRLKFTDSKNSEDSFYTNFFKVKPKIPLLLKVIPAVAVVSAAVFILKGKKKESPEPSSDEIDITLPPFPSN